jgi:6-pyruvoyltetrahydropterin/6-carboxytetrahydropterin synthase
MQHESKCLNLHGHRYVVEITCDANELDELGRVVDFSAIKLLVGGWIDAHWDHGTIANEKDTALIDVCNANGWVLYTMDGNPTAENLAAELWHIATRLLMPVNVVLSKVRVYETPNCWAEYP